MNITTQDPGEIPLIRVLSGIKRRVDRTIHPWRRSVALRRIRGLGRPGNVLVLCVGNICRSPFAAHSLRRRLEEEGKNDTHVHSAGLIGENVPSPANALRAAECRGMDLGPHRSTALSPDAVRKADLIVVMDARQARAIRRIAGGSSRRIVVLGDLDPEPIEVRGIPDPLNHPFEVFDACYERIDRCLDQLVRAWSASAERRESARV